MKAKAQRHKWTKDGEQACDRCACGARRYIRRTEREGTYSYKKYGCYETVFVAPGGREFVGYVPACERNQKETN